VVDSTLCGCLTTFLVMVSKLLILS